MLAAIGQGTLKVACFDVPPPGEGFTTVTESCPGVAVASAGTCTVKSEPLTKVALGTSTPFQLTFESAVKLEPTILSVNVALSCSLLFGEIVLILGAGLLVLKLIAAEVPPPGDGLTTATFAVPAVEMSDAAMDAVSCDALTKVVVRLLPFHSTFEPDMKLLPFIVNVKAGPSTLAEVGERDEIDGVGLF